MNEIKKIKYNIESILEVSKSNSGLFAPIFSFINKFDKLISEFPINVDELEFLIKKIEDFYEKYRPSDDPGVFYIPPKEISGTDSNVKEIIEMIKTLKNCNNQDIEKMYKTSNISPYNNTEDLKIKDKRLLNSCKNAFESKDYWNLVFNATRHLETRIRSKASLEATDTGTDLITKAFHVDNGILKIPSCATRSEEEGFFAILRGIVMFHRNAKGHREGTIEKNRALQIVNYIDFLIDMIEDAIKINRK